MSYSTTCPTPILILAMVLFLFIPVDICEFVMVPDLYILLSPKEEMAHCSS